MMRDSEAAVDAVLDVHHFEDFGHFAKGDFSHKFAHFVHAAKIGAECGLWRLQQHEG